MPLVSFYTPMKTLENQIFSDFFRGYSKKTSGGMKNDKLFCERLRIFQQT